MKRQRGYWKRFTLASFIGIFFLIIFLGCAKKEAIKNISNNEETLRDKAMTYCGYMVRKEFDKMYELEYPLYRKNVSLVKYILKVSNPKVGFQSCEVSDMRIKGDAAETDLKVKLRLKVPGAKAFDYDRIITEHWVNIDSVWYHVPDKEVTQK